MKTIQEVKQFIEDFTSDEYAVNLSKFDQNKTEEEHCKMVEAFLEKYFSLFYTSLKTGPLMTRSLDFEDDESIEWNFKVARKRKVFVIRHFKNAKLSDEILADNSDLYACYLGSDEDPEVLGMPEIYTENMSVVVVNGQFKIVSTRNINDIKDTDCVPFVWDYNTESVEFMEKMTILNEGICIESLRLMTPEDDRWLKDYNF